MYQRRYGTIAAIIVVVVGSNLLLGILYRDRRTAEAICKFVEFLEGEGLLFIYIC